jgi:hypothetical protein
MLALMKRLSTKVARSAGKQARRASESGVRLSVLLIVHTPCNSTGSEAVASTRSIVRLVFHVAGGPPVMNVTLPAPAGVGRARAGFTYPLRCER